MTKAGSCLIAWIALAATACGSGASSTQTVPPGPDPAAAAAATPAEPPAAACQGAVDSMFTVTAASEPPELRARSAKVFVNRCQQDAWSADITACMAAVKVPEDADRCEAMLTPEQRRELADELAAELDAAGVRPQIESGKPKPAKPAKPAASPAPPAPPAASPAKSSAPPKASKAREAPRAAPRAPASKAAPGRTSDPDEGGE
jgi:hypothetical protein